MRLDPVFEVPHVIAIAVIGFLLWAALLAWRWWNARNFAVDVYDAKRSQGELDAKVSEEAFRAAYLRAEAPIGETHIFGAALVCTLIIPPLISVFTRLWYEVWTLAGRFEPAATGTMVHTFGTFLFCMCIMVAVLYAALKRHYNNLPPSLNEAIRALNKAEG